MWMNNDEHHQMNKLSRQRIRIVEVCSIVCCLLFVGFFSEKYLISPVFSAQRQGTKNTSTYNAIQNYVIEGDILDRNGSTIMANASEGSGAYANYPENESYAYLLGYYSVNSGKENAYGATNNNELSGHVPCTCSVRSKLSLKHFENVKGPPRYRIFPRIGLPCARPAIV